MNEMGPFIIIIILFFGGGSRRELYQEHLTVLGAKHIANQDFGTQPLF